MDNDDAEVEDDHADDDDTGGDEKLHNNCSGRVLTCADQTPICVANANIQRF